MEWPSDLETVPEIDVETRSSNGEVHRTTVWPVVDGGDVYVRSLRGSAGRWYQELVAGPDTVVHSIGRANAGYQRKYADSPYLGTMTREEILGTTLRLEPRS